ncbi:type II secretion system protein GspM [Hyphomonas sp.]|uniref:type II secretion system protein GspM n=1 Tax=Hyphomonas sp. TaxID=87 RepID=UPI00391BCCD4
MRAAWERLQPREKLLLTAAGVALAAALIVQAGFIPLIEADETAKAKRAVAEGTIARLRRLQAAGVASVPQSGSVGDPAVFAADLGLALLGTTVTPQGSLQFRFDGAEPGVVFLWMDRIKAGTDLRLVSVEMVSAGNGRVSVTAEYAGDRQP